MLKYKILIKVSNCVPVSSFSFLNRTYQALLQALVKVYTHHFAQALSSAFFLASRWARRAILSARSACFTAWSASSCASVNDKSFWRGTSRACFLCSRLNWPFESLNSRRVSRYGPWFAFLFFFWAAAFPTRPLLLAAGIPLSWQGWSGESWWYRFRSLSKLWSRRSALFHPRGWLVIDRKKRARVIVFILVRRDPNSSFIFTK